MKKTIYFTLTLFALIAFVSSCNQNNEKIIYVKVSLPNGWAPNPQNLGSIQVQIFGVQGALPIFLSQGNNELSKQGDEFIMNLQDNKNLSLNVTGFSEYYDPGTDNSIYVSNTALIEVFVNGNLYDSRTCEFPGSGGGCGYNLTIE